MDRALQSVAATVNYKKCSSCKKTIDPDSLHKTCKPCRTKRTAKQEKIRLKMNEMHHMMVPDHTDVHNEKYDTSGASMKGYQKKACVTHRDRSRKVVAGVKRKAQKSLYELEGEERKVAMKMMKTSLNQTVRQHGKKSLSIPTVKSVASGQEYQNASLLYDVLKAKALSSYPASKDETQFLQFHGSHTIVAMSSINNIKRINLVATDLRKIARLSFEFGNATLSSGPSGSVTASYPCNCVGHTQVVAPPGAESFSGPGSLIKWARANFTSAASQTVPRLCGGKVHVTVSDDNTHPLNILGQQIIVRIDHPNI